MNKDRISFAVENIEEVQENPHSSFATMKIDFFASGKNAHNLHISEDTLRRTAKTIYNTPIVWKYDSDSDDAMSHEIDEIPAGFTPEGSPIEERRLEDGRLILSVSSLIWKKYSGRLLDIFKRDKKKSVSVEMSVLDMEENENGRELLDYKFEAITLLGRNVNPAIPLASAEMASFAFSEKQEYEKVYLEEFGYSKYAELDFKIPGDVKSSVKRGMEKYKKNKRGGNTLVLSIAKHLSENDFADPSKVKRMFKKLSSSSNLEVEDEFVKYELCGGKSGFEWSKELFQKMEEIDKRRNSYFAEEKNMPYKSMKDVNPAIKGINPQPTLSQANAIAKQADAIGVDKEKNGYAIAISNFKKTHTVEDGKWVKKKSSDGDSKEFDGTNLNEEGGENVKKEFEEKEEDVEEKPVAEEKMEETPVSEEKVEEEKMAEEEGEKVEEPESKEEKVAEAKMSLDTYLDVAFLLEMLERETEGEAEMLGVDEYAGDKEFAVAELKKEGEKDFSTVAKGMFAKMKRMSAMIGKMAENQKAYMAENESLKEFKKNIEEQRFSYEVQSTLNDVEGIVPQDEIEKSREESKSFSLENIDAWKNSVKAKAFTFSSKNEKKEKKSEQKWAFNLEVGQTKENLWKIS